MAIFGKKTNEIEINKVPVYTVQSLKRNYEPIQTVQVQLTKIFKSAHEEIIDKLGEAGAKVNADAVIGVIIHTAGWDPSTVFAFGTAIRYTEE